MHSTVDRCSNIKHDDGEATLESIPTAHSGGCAHNESMVIRGVPLPAGRHFAVTWSIPDDFGGMTEAIFRRSRAFHDLGGQRVDLLTFDRRTDYPIVERQLRERGVVTDGIRVINLYDWLRTHALPAPASSMEGALIAPIQPDEDHETRTRDRLVVARVRRDASGRIRQVDHLREDGTRVLSDRLDDGPARRLLVLYDEHGKPTRSWDRVWDLYADWLDALTAGQRSFMIVDSKTIARFMSTYRRPHVVKAHVVHASHRDATGALRATRRVALTRPRGFDVIVVLTASQARDLVHDVTPPPQVAVIPNGRGQRPRIRRGGTRMPTRGVVVASLTRRKRVSHAITAVQDANERADLGVTLDIYGDGDSRPSLQKSIAGDPRIRLRGHVPDVRDSLRAASFALFTAHSEGFPLALVEAMDAGCIPIAYDIDYGPAEIIRDGRNGYLLPAGDIEAMSAAIQTVASMPERRRRRMRSSAVRAVRPFTDRRICARWAWMLHLALIRRSPVSQPRLQSVLRRIPPLRALARTVLAVAPPPHRHSVRRR